MTNFDIKERNYWNYYLELESELYQMKKYVEFSKDNYGTFSIEFLKLYQAICSEIDVLGKHIASLINPDFSRKDNKSIRKWWIEIQSQSVYLDINGFRKNPESLINISSARVYNYLIAESFNPWLNYKVVNGISKDGKNIISLSPGCKEPTWWSDYNLVKHHRTEKDKNGKSYFSRANLKNVCESIAALYILELFVLELSVDSIDEAEAFMNKSILFQKDSLVTSKDIDNLYN